MISYSLETIEAFYREMFAEFQAGLEIAGSQEERNAVLRDAESFANNVYKFFGNRGTLNVDTFTKGLTK